MHGLTVEEQIVALLIHATVRCVERDGVDKVRNIGLRNRFSLDLICLVQSQMPHFLEPAFEEFDEQCSFVLIVQSRLFLLHRFEERLKRLEINLASRSEPNDLSVFFIKALFPFGIVDEFHSQIVDVRNMERSI
jgi:hypothetical protein